MAPYFVSEKPSGPSSAGAGAQPSRRSSETQDCQVNSAVQSPAAGQFWKQGCPFNNYVNDEGEEICLNDLVFTATSSSPQSPFFYHINKEGASARRSLELLKDCTNIRQFLMNGDTTYPRNVFGQ